MFELAKRIMNNVSSLVEHVKCDLDRCNNNVKVKVTSPRRATSPKKGRLPIKRRTV